jgi:hypothetical protein
MMARALDGINRIKQVKEIKGLLAQERRANLVELSRNIFDIYPAPNATELIKWDLRTPEEALKRAGEKCAHARRS